MLECTTGDVCIFKYLLWNSMQVALRGYEKGSAGTDPGRLIGGLDFLQGTVSIQEIKLPGLAINLDHLYIESVPGFTCPLGHIGAVRIAAGFGSVDVNRCWGLKGEGTMDIVDKAVNGLVEEDLIEMIPLGIFVSLLELKFDFLGDFFIGLVHQGVIAGGTTRGDEEYSGFKCFPENLMDLVEDSPHSSGTVDVKSGFDIGSEVGSDGLVHGGVSLRSYCIVYIII